MHLVARNNAGDPYKTIEALKPAEADLLRRFWCEEAERRSAILAPVAAILRRVRALDAWVACDCLGAGAVPPILYTRLTPGGNLSLVREPSRGAHDASCVFAWEEGTLGGGDSEPSQNGGGAARPQAAPRFLTHTDAGAATTDPTALSTPGLIRRRGADPLQRILFYVLERAGLNILRAEAADAATGLARDRAKLLMTLKAIMAAPDISLNDVMWTDTNWLYKGWILGALKRMQESKRWPRKRPLQGYLLIPADTIDDREIRCSNGDRLRVSSPVRMPSTHGDGARAPWLVLADLKIADDGKRMEVLRAYAHPRMDDSFFCVDSDHERHAARALRKGASIVYAKTNGEVRLTVSKPLEDVIVGTDSCRPDFLVTSPEGKLVIETIGYATPEYRERKARTHPIMEQIGRLFLDHRVDTDSATADTRLIRYVMGWALAGKSLRE